MPKQNQTAEQSSLQELLKREQSKLARNIFTLASFYCPIRRLPDILDFTMMQKRIELLNGNVDEGVDLWPTASPSFREKLKQNLNYTFEQQRTVDALENSVGIGRGLTPAEMFEMGLANSRIGQLQAADQAA